MMKEKYIWRIRYRMSIRNQAYEYLWENHECAKQRCGERRNHAIISVRNCRAMKNDVDALRPFSPKMGSKVSILVKADGRKRT
jgi:hypothetical protein